MVRNQEYVDLHETEAAFTEIYFYHIKNHLLPESMFNIRQQKFFLYLLVLLPSMLELSLEHFMNSHFCFVSVQASRTSPLPRVPFPILTGSGTFL